VLPKLLQYFPTHYRCISAQSFIDQLCRTNAGICG
jgi:hypothetical protein